MTNLRREVIEIVEPYRSKVIDYERRFEVSESIINDLVVKQNKFQVEMKDFMKTLLPGTSVMKSIKEVRAATNSEC